ncbi:MAG: hypothetical protein RSB67_02270 [Clostridia bacterium]
MSIGSGTYIKKEYNQEDYKNFFYRVMNEEEKQKIEELNSSEKILKLTTSTYQIKYLNGVGYIFIGEGYLILNDGAEPTHYFAKIFNTQKEALKEIANEFKSSPLKTIVQECIGNDDPYWNIPVCKLVDKIMKLNDGDETSIVELIEDSNYTSKQLFDISKYTFKVCDKLNIKLDFSKHESKSVGLPYNLTFVKK